MIVLALSPHTDDVELACGATISRLIREGHEVHYVAFSSCGKSLKQLGKSEEALAVECQNAAKIWGIKPENFRILDYDVRLFAENRQSILDELIKIRKEIDPDVVFSPSIHDVHQDHSALANEALRAFKQKTILMYEEPWNNLSFSNQLFVKVTEEDVEKKIKILSCYDSQACRDYMNPEYTRAILKVHGVQIGEEFAEVFEVPRMVLK